MATKTIYGVACGGRASYIPAANNNSQYITSSLNNVFGTPANNHYWRLKNTIKISVNNGTGWVSSNTYPDAKIKFYIKGSISGFAKVNFEINCSDNSNSNWNNIAYSNLVKSNGHQFSCTGDNIFKGQIYFYIQITAYGDAFLGAGNTNNNGYRVTIEYDDVSDTITSNPTNPTIPIGTLNPPTVTSPSDGTTLSDTQITFNFKHPYITSNNQNYSVYTTSYLQIYNFTTASWVGNTIFGNSQSSNTIESLTTPTLTSNNDYLVYVGAYVTGELDSNNQPKYSSSTGVRFSIMPHPTVTSGQYITKYSMDLLRKFKNYNPSEVASGYPASIVDGATYSNATINNTKKLNASWYNNA